MADTDILKPYKPQDFPQLEGSSTRFIVGELARIAVTLAQTIEVMKKLEARMTSHGI